MRKVLIGTASVLASIPFLAVIAGMGMFLLGGDEWPPTGDVYDDQDGVPAEMWALYNRAGARFGVPTPLLAAVSKKECDHARNPECQTPNHTGAVGPMQFLPATFAAWSWASDSPAPSILDAHDAVFAAAAKLAADGAASDPSAALYAYNTSETYVAMVEAWALSYGWAPPDPSVLATAVLDHPGLLLRAAAKKDVAAGLVDDRVLAVLLVIATRYNLYSVGPFVSGHSYFVEGTGQPSNHAFGRAVDIPVVEAVDVSASNGDAKAVVQELARLAPSLRPDEIGCPWSMRIGGRATFTKNHGDHLHFGWDS